MQQIIIHTHSGQRLETTVSPGLTLAQAVFLLGLWQGVPLCAGLGKCGLCRVRFRSNPPAPLAQETKRLGNEAVAQGWRLSCLHPANPCEIELPQPSRAALPEQSREPERETESPAPSPPIRLAVDLGTTSVQWTALQEGQPVASGKSLNPQLGLGSEIMTRLAFALRPGGADILRRLILDRLREIIASLPGPVERLCIAGNPTMTGLLLGHDLRGLAAAPYRLDEPCGRDFELAPDLPPAYVPPHLAPFVGADISAGLAALTLAPETHPAYPLLLADLGTNGEFILALSPESLLCASVPMGPALEGVGLRFGRTAGPGAITGFTLTPSGPKHTYFHNNPDGPAGMTGTGHLSLVALLLRVGLLTPEGAFAQPASPLANKLAAQLTSLDGEPAFRVTDDILLPASDVEEILKVKAAFNLALSRLLLEAGLAPGGLASLHLAGAMGEHAAMADLETLGFLPSSLLPLSHKAGNTSLAGAELLLTSPALRERLSRLPAPRVLDLASDHAFGSQFLHRMVFRHVL
ncbi:MAG: ASKHA domain-containing protein [Desulfovibrionaceae bacterium]